MAKLYADVSVALGAPFGMKYAEEYAVYEFRGDRPQAPSCPVSMADSDTVRQWWREVDAHGFDRPTLDRFPQFSAIVWKRPSIAVQVPPKTAEIDQTWLQN